MHVQRMLKSVGVYKLAGILSKIYGKNRRENGDFIHDHDLAKKRFGSNLFFIEIYYVITVCTNYVFISGKCRLIKKW